MVPGGGVCACAYSTSREREERGRGKLLHRANENLESCEDDFSIFSERNYFYKELEKVAEENHHQQ